MGQRQDFRSINDDFKMEILRMIILLIAWECEIGRFPTCLV